MTEKHYAREAISSVAASPWILLNTRVSPFNVFAHVTVSVGADLTYTVEYTPDILLTSGSSADAFDLPDFADVTATRAKAIITPVSGIRLNVTARTSGTATLTVMQAGLG